MIYLDNAATTYHKPPEVAEAVFNALQGTGSSGRGAHGASLEASRIVFRTRAAISEIFNVTDPSRVVFTSNATESLNIAIQGLLSPGDRCITTAMEHNSVLRPLYHMETKGIRLDILPADSRGRVDPGLFEAAIRPDTKAIIMAHGSNVTGNVTDIQAIGDLCRRHRLLFIVDAAQTAGLLPIDMVRSHISALCLSGHKSLLGPQGTGALCLAEGVLPEPLIYGGTGMDSFAKNMPSVLPENLEAGTLNVHGLAGLLASCGYIRSYGQDRMHREATALSKAFIDGIMDIEGLVLYGDFSDGNRTPVVSLNIRDMDAGELADELYERFGIAVRAGAHCAPLVHRTFGTEKQGMVRFSFSHFNTMEEVKAAIDALRTIGEEAR
ncbi:aminotransferase class V-fold PLP-dependent enzyme [Youngiibacter fragilis]|uniref:cysteine desulfurase n=1 Tax=Youngiibacter fragilis 232.1 TaxID=994573 RepID=V7I4M3_9CLOT|nr:aminotransferase class V-fold PLP-dependent enzyme [Youngiibacter fragilis]ETA80124.1 cysteine desulfurase [Youngiibacter fragilis 232.1]